jgi:hypothetical protein
MISRLGEYLMNAFAPHMLTPAQLDRRSLLKGIIFGAVAVSPPHSPTPIPVLTVCGAAGAKAISCPTS